jgi:hypothetical protein
MFSLMYMLWRSLFILLSLFFWSLCCLFFLRFTGYDYPFGIFKLFLSILWKIKRYKSNHIDIIMFCIYRIDQLAFERRWCVLSESDFLRHFFFQFTNISCCYRKAHIIYFCIFQFKILIIIKVGDKNNNTTDATSGAGTVYPSGAPQFHPSF